MCYVWSVPEFPITGGITSVRVFKTLFVVPPLLMDILPNVITLVMFLAGDLEPEEPEKSSDIEVQQDKIKEYEEKIAALMSTENSTDAALAQEERKQLQAKIDAAMAEIEKLNGYYEKAQERYKAKMEKFKAAKAAKAAKKAEKQSSTTDDTSDKPTQQV